MEFMDYPNQFATRKNTAFGIAAILLLAAALIGTGGCQKRMERHGPPMKVNSIDHSVKQFHNLGWTGAQSHPLTSSVSFQDPMDSESTISPGGIVITSVADASPAQLAKLKVGDVIVGVEDKWLPIKDDPTLDFIKELELNVVTGAETTELRIYDGRRCKTVEIKNVADSLEPGQDYQVVRFQNALELGLKHLAGEQKEWGSFALTEANSDVILQTAAIAGLSFLSSADDQFQPNIEKCLAYVGQNIDERITAATKAKESSPAPTTEPPKAGVIMMKMPEFKMDPLTAAGVAQFLAETDVQMIDKGWMPRLMGIVGSFSKSQDESGGWDLDDAPETELDPGATHTTNQVLLAIGMLERKGVMGNPGTIEKACGFLKKQMELRSGSNLDRRYKNALTAGTAAALMSINCQTTDSFLKQAAEDGLMGAGQCYASPISTLPGILSTAVLARQTGNDAWAQFHNETKYWLSSLQAPDGSFRDFPMAKSDQDRATYKSANSHWKAAHCCLLLSMQSGNLKKLTAESKSPMMVARPQQWQNGRGLKKCNS